MPREVSPTRHRGVELFAESGEEHARFPFFIYGDDRRLAACAFSIRIAQLDLVVCLAERAVNHLARLAEFHCLFLVFDVDDRNGIRCLADQRDLVASFQGSEIAFRQSWLGGSALRCR